MSMSPTTLSACATSCAADRTHLWPEVTKSPLEQTITIQPVREQDDLTWEQSLLAICMASNAKADL